MVDQNKIKLTFSYVTLFLVCVISASVFNLSSAYAFNYIEHSYLTDKSCYLAQKIMAKQMNLGQKQLTSKYLALALYCPSNWDRPYCKEGYKQAMGQINATSKTSIIEGEYSVTLGDISAIADHTKHFGAIKKYPRASQDGLLSTVVEWVSNGEAGADGYIEDVAEDSCEVDELVDWKQLENDINEYFKSKAVFKGQDFLPTRRIPLNKGPADPAGLYSFDNPQYIDFVLKNHHHFGKESYRSWLGFHSVAVDISRLGCEEINNTEFNCKEITKRLLLRLSQWEKNASAELLAPVKSQLKSLANDSSLQNQMTSDFLSLVFEGAGLHFIQDNLSGGHLRVTREAYNLEDSRFYHDNDSKNGVIAKYPTAIQTQTFVAFGDDYLLGKNLEVTNKQCETTRTAAENSSCLLRQQRGLIVASTAASILDWAQSGKRFYQSECDKNELDQFVCKHLPTSSVHLSGESIADSKANIELADLPQPQPDFSYQSLLTSMAVDPKMKWQRFGMRLHFLSALGDEATWLKSYDFGLYSMQGENVNQNALEFSFMFHWRWSARFLINMAPYVEIADESTSLYRKTKLSIGPSIGVTALPEGWIRLPLEITLLWKAPREIYSSKDMTHDDVQNIHWFELSLGISVF